MLTDLPLLLCVNLQNEFLLECSPNWIADGAMILELCLTIQSEWRRRMLPVAHLKRIASEAYFSPSSDMSDWIECSRPLPFELAFEHSMPSAYSSTKFREYMKHIGSIQCVVIGFSLQDSIISTIIDGYHRGDEFRVLSNAVGCKAGQNGSLKLPILEVLSTFSKITDYKVIGDPH